MVLKRMIQDAIWLNKLIILSYACHLKRLFVYK